MICAVRDLDIYYEDIGTGRPLFAFHGWGLDHRHIQADVEPICEQRPGWRRIYPDLPGMGKTRGVSWITEFEQVLDLMVQFIDAVAPGQRFCAMGHSRGAYLAHALVNRSGTRMDGLMLNAPGGYGSQEPLPEHRVVHRDEAFLAALTPEEAKNYPTFIVTQSMALLDTLRTTVAAGAALADEPFLAALRQHFALSFPVGNLPEPFPAPTLILTGRFDCWVGYKPAFAFLDQFPRATYAVLDGAGHAVAIEKQALFRALVGEWLDRVEDYAPENGSA